MKYKIFLTSRFKKDVKHLSEKDKFEDDILILSAYRIASHSQLF